MVTVDLAEDELSLSLSDTLGESYHFDIFQFVSIRRFRILLLPHMKHVTPTVCPVGHPGWILRGIEYESIDSGSINDVWEVIDLRRIWLVPAQVNCGVGRI